MTLPRTYDQNIHDSMTPDEAAIDIVDKQVADGSCPPSYAHLRKIQYSHDISFARYRETRRDIPLGGSSPLS